MDHAEVGAGARRFNPLRLQQSEDPLALLARSDTDLHRWQKTLGDHNRFEKLFLEVRNRWDADFYTDRAQLLQQHNATFRKRSEVAAEKFPPPKKPPVSHQLRELQCRLDPVVRRKKKTQDGEDRQVVLSMLPSIFHAGVPYGAAPELSSTLRSDMTTLPSHDSHDPPDGHLAVPHAAERRRISGTSSGAQERTDRVSTGSPALLPEEDESPTGMRSISAARGSRLSEPEMPRTLAILVFRNAERMHTGRTVFVRRWPVSKMAELLDACGEVCRPIVSPVQALYTADLRPVRSLRQVKSGETYLMKGQEALDPPSLFFNHRHALQASSSLRSLSQAQEAVAAEQDELERFLPSPWHAASQVMSMSPSEPPVGSPPWPSVKPPSVACRGRKWQVDLSLGMTISWGGLGHPHQHPCFETWGRALDSQSMYALDSET